MYTRYCNNPECINGHTDIGGNGPYTGRGASFCSRLCGQNYIAKIRSKNKVKLKSDNVWRNYSKKEKEIIKKGFENNKSYKDIAIDIKNILGIGRTEDGIRCHVERNRSEYGYKDTITPQITFKSILENKMTKFEVLDSPDAFTENEVERIFEELVKKTSQKLGKNKYNITLKFPEDKPIAIAFMSDIHLGNSGVDYKTLDKHINLINNLDNMYCYVGGDLIDNFIIEKILEATDASEVAVSTQWKLAEYFLKKFDNNLIALGNGNHTQWTKKKALFDNLSIVSQKLNILYTAYGAYITLKLGSTEQEYKIHVRHKFRFNSSLNRHNAHKRLYEYGPELCDILVLEHHHEPDTETFWRHGEKRYAISTGSYKMEDNYALDCGYFHANIGVPCVVLFPDRRKIIMFEELEDCALFMKYVNNEYQ